MQRLLQDTGIMKKILAMMLMLGLVAITTAGVNAWKIKSIDERYAVLVENRLPAITQMVRSHRQAARDAGPRRESDGAARGRARASGAGCRAAAIRRGSSSARH